MDVMEVSNDSYAGLATCTGNLLVDLKIIWPVYSFVIWVLPNGPRRINHKLVDKWHENQLLYPLN